MSRVKELKEIISLAQEEIAEIQEQCSHPKACVTFKYGSNTGNYDPSCDVYWKDFKCSLCEANWRKYSDQEGYRDYK